MMLAVGGTEVAVILVEQPSGGFKISFRSRCGTGLQPAGRAVRRRRTSQGRRRRFSKEPLDVVRTRVLDAVRQAMR